MMQRYGMKLEDINKTHDMVKDDSLKISIVRNPYESISSFVAMDCGFNPEKNILDITDKAIELYASFQKYLLEDFDGIIFSYDALINVPERVLREIEAKFSLEPKNKNTLVSNITPDSPGHYHVVSSKNLDLMKTAKQIIERKHLAECFNLYQEVLKRAIA
jgi:hypothetical protein